MVMKNGGASYVIKKFFVELSTEVREQLLKLTRAGVVSARNWNGITYHVS